MRIFLQFFFSIQSPECLKTLQDVWLNIEIEPRNNDCILVSIFYKLEGLPDGCHASPGRQRGSIYITSNLVVSSNFTGEHTMSFLDQPELPQITLNLLQILNTELTRDNAPYVFILVPLQVVTENSIIEDSLGDKKVSKGIDILST